MNATLLVKPCCWWVSSVGDSEKVHRSCHHIQIWVPPPLERSCALGTMVAKRVKHGERPKELELFNLKDSEWGRWVELEADTVCGGVGAWGQGPVDGNAHTRSASKRRPPTQFGQLGCPMTEHAATLQDSSLFPAGRRGNRAEGVPTWLMGVKSGFLKFPARCRGCFLK